MRVLLFLLYLLFIPLAYATSSDATQTARFIADAFSFNQKTGTTIYTGHVQMQQGTTTLIADKLVIYKDSAGSVKQIIATGKPAHYKTLPDNQKNLIDASGNTILYEPQKKTATALGNGYIVQGQNSLKGEHIVYDMVAQTVNSLPPDRGNQSKSLLIIQPQDPPGK